MLQTRYAALSFRTCRNIVAVSGSAAARLLSVVQVELVLQFANSRLPKVVQLWDAMKHMRAEDAEHREAIDVLVDRSADKFLYMLRRRAADAMASGEVAQSDAIAYMLAYLEASGWRPSSEFAEALSDSFGGGGK